MINTALKFRSPVEVADYLNREAASIRGRVSRASAPSQRIMSSEAAAYERAARLILNLETEAARGRMMLTHTQAINGEAPARYLAITLAHIDVLHDLGANARQLRAADEEARRHFTDLAAALGYHAEPITARDVLKREFAESLEGRSEPSAELVAMRAQIEGAV